MRLFGASTNRYSLLVFCCCFFNPHCIIRLNMRECVCTQTSVLDIIIIQCEHNTLKRAMKSARMWSIRKKSGSNSSTSTSTIVNKNKRKNKRGKAHPFSCLHISMLPTAWRMCECHGMPASGWWIRVIFWWNSHHEWNESNILPSMFQLRISRHDFVKTHMRVESIKKKKTLKAQYARRKRASENQQ